MNYNAQFVKYDQLVPHDIYCSKIGASNEVCMENLNKLEN